MSHEPSTFLLGESAIPTHSVNLAPDLPGDPLARPNRQTRQPAGPPDLTPFFPMALIEQEVSPEPEIEIPDAVREAYGLWRPTPLRRARRPQAALGTPAHIFFKYDAYLAGTLEDPEFSEADRDAALAALPGGVPAVG